MEKMFGYSVYLVVCDCRNHGSHILINCKEVGRKPPTFTDASVIASELINSGYEFDQGSIIFNRFRYKVPIISFSCF